MPDVTTVLSALRVELVAAGLVRHPSTPDPSTPPALAPLFLEPIDGAPAPGTRDAPEDDAEVTITASLSGDLPNAAPDTYRRTSIIDVRYRSANTRGLARARAAHAGLFDHLVGRPDQGLGWTMGATGATPVLILSSALFGGLGRIQASRSHGFDELAKFALEYLPD